MPKYSVIDHDGDFIAVIDAENAEEALDKAKEKYPYVGSVEERGEIVPHGAAR